MAKKQEVEQETESPETFRALVSTYDEERKDWYFAASSKGKEVGRVYGKFYVTLPADMAAAEALGAQATTTFTDDRDQEVKLVGPIAPLLRKWYADHLEPVRGEYRDMCLKGVSVTAESFQQMLDEKQPYTGRGGGFRKPQYETDELARINAIKDPKERIAALSAYLTKGGAVVVAAE